MPQVRKALEGAGIEVRSIISQHKEEVGEDASPDEGAKEGSDGK